MPRRSSGESATAELLLDALVALVDAAKRSTGSWASRRPQKERLRWLWQGCVLALEKGDDESAFLLRGRARETRDLIEQTNREAGARGEGIGLAISAYARAVLGNGLGEYDEALAAASAGEHREVVAENWGSAS